MSRHTTVIIGASIGGVRTAQALRAAGYRERIVLVSDEAVLPYDKPPLSKAFLAGSASSDDIALLSQAEADELGIELQLGRRANHLDLARNTVEVDSGERLGFDHCVIATGARPRPSPWGQPEGVHLLRTMDDSRRLRAELTPDRRLVVIGGGFIGAEIASTARSLGLAVTMVDPTAVPMERVLGSEIGRRFTRLHQDHGVTTLFSTGVQGLSGQRDGFTINLTDGRTLEADIVVVGIGAIPNDDWLVSSGLDIDNGVVCDKYLRVPDAPNVFAIGDVCRWQNPRHDRLTRIEHWTNAVEHASVVAHNITHPMQLMSCAPVEYVWSDQYDWQIRVAGEAGIAEYRHVEVIGEDAATGRFAALYSADGRIFSGIVAVNWPRALVAARRALKERIPYPEIRRTLDQLAQSQRATSTGV